MGMPISITYFVHGTTTDNEQGISSGWFDVALSEKGVQQSIELKDKIGDKKFDAIFCSDLKRAVDSAKLSFEGMAPIVPDARLRECNYGDYNAKPSAIVEPMQEKMITERFPNGESYEDVKARIAAFFGIFKTELQRQVGCDCGAQSAAARARCVAARENLGTSVRRRLAEDPCVAAGVGV